MALSGGNVLGAAGSKSMLEAESFREALTAAQPGVFGQSWSRNEVDDEEALRWASLERLPTFDRIRKGVLRQVLDDGKVVHNEINVKKLGRHDRKAFVDAILKKVEEDNEGFLRRIRERVDRVGIELPKIEIRYQNLSVEGNVHVGSRALPTLLNVIFTFIEAILGLIGVAPTKKRTIKILEDISGIVRPSRMTLLLGPPGAGKTTLLLALAAKIEKDLMVTGNVTYCGHEFDEFVPQRTCAYISEQDLHYGEMTVREILDFSGRCLGVGTRCELLAEICRLEKEAGIRPDPEIDAFMKAIAVEGQQSNVLTDYVIKILGLDICADIIVGNEMIRGISGGQKKRVTAGEMLTGPEKVLLMDEISTGLDSATTFQICKYMRQLAHIMDVTMVISLVQPSPETYGLFDDIILLSEGRIVYQGPRENVLEFFESMGFKCPERKGVADFLQEVTSKKDQEQYWCRSNQLYRFVSVSEFSRAFQSFHVGRELRSELSVPYDKSKTHPAALVKQKYSLSNWKLFKACFSREWLLIKRNSFLYIFKTIQITILSLIAMTVFLRTTMPHDSILDGGKYLGALFYSLVTVMFNGIAELALTVFRLPVFYRQRDNFFYQSWAFAIPIWVLRIPLSFVESAIWIVLTYYTIGFAPAPSRFFKQFLAYFGVHQMALSLFRFLAAVGRTLVMANTLGFFTLLAVLLLGGFIIAKDDIKPCMIWAYYMSPMMYAQNALVINEFLDKRWSLPNADPRINESTIGRVLLASRGFFTQERWYWICIGALLGFTFLFNIFFILALRYLNPLVGSKAIVLDDDDNDKRNTGPPIQARECIDMTTMSSLAQHRFSMETSRSGMIMPFKPLYLSFSHINYYVDMPAGMRSQGHEKNHLQLLRDVSGVFRPGVLTALVGVSGAGKTTLMDVLAGRKTSGYIEGSISISGFPKKQETFARISGYCEQNDIHSPHVTVYESLCFSAWLRLPSEVDSKTRKAFVEEVMDLVELDQIRHMLVGLPGVDGLSTEQRKRLTIAIELVANPSIIFMDEPTSGLDARAAAIVMRTVRNTVNTGRTVVCTIHQPSIDIFEAFDELLLMKRGGQVIYEGPLGQHSEKLIEYFEAIQGVAKIKDGYNPATWMLEITAPQVESQLDVDFAAIYANSSLYKRNQELITELSTPTAGSKDLYFPTKYSQPFFVQCKACLWKQHWSYWRNAPYNVSRFLITVVCGVFFGVIFWGKGKQVVKAQDLLNFSGAMYSAVFFLGATNASAVLAVVAIERSVFYRERAAGMYSALPHALSQVAIEIMYVAIQTLVYSLLLYSMMGLQWTVGKFFYFYYFIGFSFIYFTMCGMMLVALSPNHNIAGISLSFLLNLWNIFAGFLLPRPKIPLWWRWYFWGCPVSWTLYGLVTSQLGDNHSLIRVLGVGDMTVQMFLKEEFGYDHSFIPQVVVAHIGWALLFSFVFAYCIKFLNFQKR